MAHREKFSATLNPEEMPARPGTVEELEECVWKVTRMIATGVIGTTQGREVLNGLKTLNEVLGFRTRLAAIEKQLEKAKR
jgi:hypothetical protein